jgi:hypothetical protein
MMVDIEHWLWNTVNGNKIEEGDFRVKHYINYINISRMFANEHFVCIRAAQMYYNFNEDPQPTKTYWSMFLKTDAPVNYQGYSTSYLDGDVKKYEKIIGMSLDNKI